MEDIEYDFYYSPTCLYMLKNDNYSNYVEPLFKGQIYTEMIRKGEKPYTEHYGDLVKLGTGTNKDITYK